MTLEEKTIQFIQKVAESYPNEILYAGNSGGKDSAVLDYLLQKSGIKTMFLNILIYFGRLL